MSPNIYKQQEIKNATTKPSFSVNFTYLMPEHIFYDTLIDIEESIEYIKTFR